MEQINYKRHNAIKAKFNLSTHCPSVTVKQKPRSSIITKSLLPLICLLGDFQFLGAGLYSNARVVHSGYVLWKQSPDAPNQPSSNCPLFYSKKNIFLFSPPLILMRFFVQQQYRYKTRISQESGTVISIAQHLKIVQQILAIQKPKNDKCFVDHISMSHRLKSPLTGETTTADTVTVCIWDL